MAQESIREGARAAPELEWQARSELAGFYRIVHREGLTDLIHNHITLRVPGTHDEFFINAFGLDYSEITASNLLQVDLRGNLVRVHTENAKTNRAGFLIHSAIHAARHDLACIAHVHTPATVAVASLDCGLLMSNQSALRFADDLSYHDYEGPVFREEEGRRLIASLGTYDNMILRNHGVLACGRTIAHAYVNLMALEAACRIQVQMLSCGRSIQPIKDHALEQSRLIYAIARNPKDGNVADYPGPELEWRAALRTLDRVDPTYRT